MQSESSTSQNTAEVEEDKENRSKKRKVLSKDDVARELVGFMKSKSALGERNEDELFLESLAPALKRIDPAKKMSCKMAIMKVIDDYGTQGTREHQLGYQPQWQNGGQEGCHNDWYGGHWLPQQTAAPSASDEVIYSNPMTGPNYTYLY